MYQKTLIGVVLTGIIFVTVSCTGSQPRTLSHAPEPVTFEELSAEIIDGGQPTILNVWASWCIPCRSEAPLFRTAANENIQITFISLNVRDDPSDAALFITEHYTDVEMNHYANPLGSIPVDLGAGRGVPTTFFFDNEGSLIRTHLGIIDEPALALYLDEIQR